jgi:predicted nuclease of predicted toxin-antitoxin system
MARYLIDVNLPYYFSIWRGDEYLHLRDVGDNWTDGRIWVYAKEMDLTIVSKDADFSDRILISDPPPRVIHIRIGNLKMREFHQAIAQRWDTICHLSRSHKLVQVFEDRIEAIDRAIL